MDREKVVKGLECCIRHGESPTAGCGYKNECPYEREGVVCWIALNKDALELLKEYEVRELTEKEWSKWKKDRNRDPVCILWENDTSPIWILNPNDVHEPAFLMGKLKLFNGKPTHEQCKAVKWG